MTEPQFPIRMIWNEDGEIESFEDKDDLLCNLEEFDSDYDRSEAVVTDALGRAVWLRVCLREGICDVRLLDPIGPGNK
ncbi:MAG: hypothetical protein ABIK28_14375 [Planctomycetota bacterium]